MIIGLLAIFAVDLADAFWVARLGTLELAALGFCFPAVHVIFSISLGLSTAGTAVTVSYTHLTLPTSDLV